MKSKRDNSISTKKRTSAKPKSVKQKEPKVSRTHKPDGMELVEWQQQLRKQFGENQNFVLKNTGEHPIFSDFHHFLEGIPRDSGHEVRCYDDVMEYIAGHQDAGHRQALVRERLQDGIDSPLLASLIKTQLYPYQREGVLFAATAGRCLIGDDMGLGKTIQALAAAELMAELFAVARVLIVSPTSLKHQWKAEIEKFTDRSAEVVEGPIRQRRPLYQNGSFYKLINYELVHRGKLPEISIAGTGSADADRFRAGTAV